MLRCGPGRVDETPGMFSFSIHRLLRGRPGQRLADLLDQLEVVVWEQPRRAQGLAYVNERVEQMLGVDAEQFRRSGVWEAMVHPDDLARVRESWATIDDAGRVECEYRMVRPDGAVVWVLELTQRLGRGGNRRGDALRGVLIDVTERRRTEQDLRQLATLVREIPIALQIVSLDDPDDAASMRIAACNKATTEMLGMTEEEVLAWSFRENRERVDMSFWGQFADVARTGEPLVIDELAVKDYLGRARTYRIVAVGLPDRAVGISTEDVTERADAAASMRHLALHDSLTGLANRSHLQERIEAALAHAAATDTRAGLLMMDLDQFKEVNDALGHHHGDRLLVELGHRIASLAPPGSTVARLGGDEFAVLLSGAGDEPVTTRGALELAHSIRRSLEEPAVIDGISLQSGVSIGVAMCPDHGTDAETLTQRADVAMYKAKASGVGVSLYITDHDHSSARRLTLLGELRAGIDSGQFVCHYQPRVDLTTGDVVDVEALVRWQHPELGLVPPADFIGLAEVSGTIQPLTEHVLQTAAHDIAALCEAGHDLGVAVNLSVRNLYDPGLVDSIVRALGTSGLASDRLRVEITESELMDDPALARGVLSHLRDQGIGISVDDFGTGYSSLAYLRDLPISEVKIDRSFVAAMTDGDPVLARSIIALAHNLGMRAVAEGVETGPALQELTRFGCDSAQGFFIARPLPIDELAPFLARDGDHYRGWIRDGHKPGQEWEAPLTRR